MRRPVDALPFFRYLRSKHISMDKHERMNCLLTKVVWVATILAALAFTPMQIAQGVRPTAFNITTMVLFSALFVWAGWRGLLRTNNPASRLNPLSINRRWRSTLDGPAAGQPLDEPAEEDHLELRRRRRDRRIRRTLAATTKPPKPTS